MLIFLNTGCARTTLPYFERTFLRINYVDITKFNLHLELNGYRIIMRYVLRSGSCYTFVDYQTHINLLKPSGNFTYHQV
jgi:hypothetical protein